MPPASGSSTAACHVWAPGAQACPRTASTAKTWKASSRSRGRRKAGGRSARRRRTDETSRAARGAGEPHAGVPRQQRRPAPRALAEGEEPVGPAPGDAGQDLALAGARDGQAGAQEAPGQAGHDVRLGLARRERALQRQERAGVGVGQGHPGGGAAPAGEEPRAQRDEAGLAHGGLVGLAEAEGDRPAPDAAEEFRGERQDDGRVVGGVAPGIGRELIGEFRLRQQNLRGAPPLGRPPQPDEGGVVGLRPGDHPGLQQAGDHPVGGLRESVLRGRAAVAVLAGTAPPRRISGAPAASRKARIARATWAQPPPAAQSQRA
ncbi:hypothetical protein SR39_07405 [Methylobacterium radiotolerans]|nr:hypothetical protein SR39_07405 [Methylobacterium radiotolerans]